MRHDDHRHARLGQVQHHVQHFLDHLRVERARRLVKQHDLGLHSQRTRNRHALLLPARKLARVRIRLLGNADALQLLHCDAVGLFLGALAHEPLCNRHVLQHRQVRKQVELLEHHADLGPHVVDVGALVLQMHAVDVDAAAGGHFEVVDAAQNRALARPARADDNHDFAALDVEIDAFNGLYAAEVFVQSVNDNNAVIHVTSHPGAGDSRTSAAASSARWSS